MRYCSWVQKPDLNAFNFLDEPVADWLQSFRGPRIKPVDDCGVDEGWKVTSPNLQNTAHRRDTQDYLQRRKQREKVYHVH